MLFADVCSEEAKMANIFQLRTDGFFNAELRGGELKQNLKHLHVLFFFFFGSFKKLTQKMPGKTRLVKSYKTVGIRIDTDNFCDRIRKKSIPLKDSFSNKFFMRN